ncbi:MAG: inositol 2-dehydrogenase [Treponema sp. GWB1_62_6]|nr:MAG: inositol 2-dehydrogenase [Treponema sp. GWA1_62_8]OHE66661.1 MAG: inositol 2-dehydrogenase [Treponema sp. GWC1_61_84]OHE70988.1 MAG: inositol 2-dehydrogenase [Treponema sp. GWB1_62_6]OHE74492.1 MAG: inositol 2-dehydrogenase [Treponema sp. RIFOXYC1_FULL_61_9]HCM25673.1 inositol 2-dehydrogenase [Treponema sp.]
MAGKLRIGVIGAGRIGKLHAENIAYFIPQAKLEGIADVMMTPDMESWAKGLGARIVTKDVSALLADKDIDAVIICSSTDTHADMVVLAAKAGKHIFCEKPVDLTVAKVNAALAAVKAAKVKMQVGFNRRFDHNFRTVREMTLAGKVGDVQMVKITSRDPAPPPATYVAVSGGIFLDMMIHDFDMARFQAGSEVVEVHATGAVLIDPAIGKAGDVDTAIVTLKFANGALGVIDNSRKAAYGYDQRVEVFGSKGCAQAENDTPSTVKLSNDEGVSGDKPMYFFLERYKTAFIDEMKAFVSAVLEGKDVPVSGEDGLRDLLVGLAAKKSLAENRSVRIDEIG